MFNRPLEIHAVDPGPPERLTFLEEFTYEQHGDGFELEAERRAVNLSADGRIIELDERDAPNSLVCRARYQNGEAVK